MAFYVEDGRKHWNKWIWKKKKRKRTKLSPIHLVRRTREADETHLDPDPNPDLDSDLGHKSNFGKFFKIEEVSWGDGQVLGVRLVSEEGAEEAGVGVGAGGREATVAGHRIWGLGLVLAQDVTKSYSEDVVLSESEEDSVSFVTMRNREQYYGWSLWVVVSVGQVPLLRCFRSC
ncbi:hypothetical protein K435DRAFT_811173 [Dendrothele bispora CBS 962.96]|uniref:Uncharacterized protein n=1 Tax=Dendrothele bispora (strain CBS 962.96) TaxID=1314807 RepID=A0A4S8KTV1_DENBC|nr:hypothetical protein K435DRAFT_811173 [Dendrothele bispora CBS 962.96]